ncbi:hypothetical protein BpHYR1_030740 [Brachionus plicatilis]|uniref:Uncharacterized protein n=1 Tax=Brachionus plicatilis TaxID=10195 RepID=A0A3M7PSG7_BRAPC|nr:hypothetical protein BpHYR1_030740 [Brachionus plicatilis]
MVKRIYEQVRSEILSIKRLYNLLNEKIIKKYHSKCSIHKFGIRLETDLLVKEAKTEFSLDQRKNLKFCPLNYVPFDKNLKDECLLSTDQYC